MVAFNNCRIARQYSFLLIPETEQSGDVRKMEKKIDRSQRTVASATCVCCVWQIIRFSLLLLTAAHPLSPFDRSAGRMWSVLTCHWLSSLPPGDRRQTNSLYCSYIKCSQCELKPELLRVLPGDVPLTSCATVIRHSWCPAKCDRGQCARSSSSMIDLV